MLEIEFILHAVYGSSITDEASVPAVNQVSGSLKCHLIFFLDIRHTDTKSENVKMCI